MAVFVDPRHVVPNLSPTLHSEGTDNSRRMPQGVLLLPAGCLRKWGMLLWLQIVLPLICGVH